MLSDALQAFCPLCMTEDETLLHAPCGHGYCHVCWEGLVLVALADTSTTKVKTGAQDLLDLSKLQCPGCTCVSRSLTSASAATHAVIHSYTAERMDKFISLSFIQAVVPSTTNQIALCICKVSTEHLQSATRSTRSNPRTHCHQLPHCLQPAMFRTSHLSTSVRPCLQPSASVAQSSSAACKRTSSLACAVKPVLLVI
jgi:hypothetical protein